MEVLIANGISVATVSRTSFRNFVEITLRGQKRELMCQAASYTASTKIGWSWGESLIGKEKLLS